MDYPDKELRVIQLKKKYNLTDAEAERRVGILEKLLEVARRRAAGEKAKPLIDAMARIGIKVTVIKGED